jgi:hypothetical protein
VALVVDEAALGGRVLDDALVEIDADLSLGGLEADTGDVELVQHGVDIGRWLLGGAGGGRGEEGGQAEGWRETVEREGQAHLAAPNYAGRDGPRLVGCDGFNLNFRRAFGIQDRYRAEGVPV